MKINNILISGISTVLPKKIIKVEDLTDDFGIDDIRKVIRATGIREFRIADDGVTSSDLCFKAADHLIKKLEIDKSSIDGLIFVSQTNDYLLPQTSNILQHRIGLSEKTYCLDIRLGCSGYVVGLIQAAMLINIGICSNVIVLAGDTTSKIINKKDKALRLIFGDAASATLVTKGQNTLFFDIRNDGSGYKDLIVPAGSFRNPSSSLTAQVKKDSDNNYRSDDDLFMDGTQIFNFAINKVPKMIDSLLNDYKLSYNHIGTFIFHQANEFMINYLAKKMKLDSRKVPINIKEVGNTGPASIPLTISSTSEGFRELVLMCGFGVGLSWACMITDLSNCKIFQTIDYE